MKRRVAYALATILGSLAVMIVSTASWAYIHQDETPNELLK
ncbi:cyclic lactone autoinducer peptide [Cohnella silvisoli]|uniref:Cyclic lactone autoinducer peptide n=1 Tax=Cohnella silvisoli TaxID=2873699 RepID=A0ABV1KUV3_9BACL|nr:cyclic lactone autoinducer peptide [Cohnella silvisoli]MCD9023292.1 cyclic lactone autoinducer peptide [Cohnella silvisoli]